MAHFGRCGGWPLYRERAFRRSRSFPVLPAPLGWVLLASRGGGGRGVRRQGAIAMPIVNRIAAPHGEIAAWRHDIHAHPELLYDGHRTAATVAAQLTAFGCDEVA